MPMPVVARHEVSEGFLGIVTPVRTPHICVLRNGPYPSPLPCMRKYTKNLRSSCRIANIVQWQGGQSRLTNLDTLHPDRQMYPTFSQLDDPSSHFRRVESEMRVLAAAEEVREQHFDHQDPYLELSNRCCIIAP